MLLLNSLNTYKNIIKTEIKNKKEQSLQLPEMVKWTYNGIRKIKQA